MRQMFFCILATWSLAANALSQTDKAKLLADIESTPRSTAALSSLPNRFIEFKSALYFAATTELGEELWKLSAKGPELVKDIYPGELGAFRTCPNTPFQVLGNTLFFSASDAVHGCELWKTDGTTAGTTMVTDIRSGRSGSSPQLFMVLQGQLVFTATDNSGSFALYKSDGTEKGTVKLDLPARLFGSRIVWGRHIYFAGAHSASGIELWRTDLTRAGTTIVSDIMPGSGSSNPSEFTIIGKHMFFSAAGELWRTDGSSKGTVLLKDIRPGTQPSNPRKLTVLGNKLLFVANDGTTGNEVWVSDGTSTGTKVVADVQARFSTAEPGKFTVFGKSLYFVNRQPATGAELWKTDGTAAGTGIVTDIATGPASSSPSALAVVNGRLYFSAYTASTGSEPWVSDGTSKGTTQLKDLYPGARSSQPAQFRVFNKRVLFTAGAQPPVGVELFVTDGTSAGTQLLADLYKAKPQTLPSDPQDFVAGPGRIYFAATQDKTGREPWVYSGTPAKLGDLNKGRFGSDPKDFVWTPFGTFFTATNSSTGRELYWYDGTTQARLVKDISPGVRSSDPLLLTPFRNGVVFAADESNGKVPYYSDGTANGTVRLLLASATRNQFTFTPFGDKLLFVARRPGPHGSLYITDGTASGTKALPVRYPIASVLGERRFTLIGKYALFAAGATSRTLWRTDGSASGTTQISNIDPYYFTRVDDTVYFLGVKNSRLRTLWKTDGTTLSLVYDISPGFIDSALYSAGNRLYFLGVRDTTGKELWTSDGTKQGTRLVKDITTTPSRNSSTNFLFVRPLENGRILLLADDNRNGTELWGSDGTANGTTLLTNTAGPFHGVFPLGRLGHRRFLFRDARNQKVGGELMVTDGTKAGTRVASDIWPGAKGSDPGPHVLAGGMVYFAATDPTKGREPFVWNPGATSKEVEMGCSHHSKPRLRITDPVLGQNVQASLHGAAAQPTVLLVTELPTSVTLTHRCTFYLKFGPSDICLTGTTSTTGSLTFKMSIPAIASLSGLKLAAQAAVSNPANTPLGIDVSNAFELVLGR